MACYLPKINYPLQINHKISGLSIIAIIVILLFTGCSTQKRYKHPDGNRILLTGQLTLQERLDSVLAQRHLTKLISENRLGITLFDLNTTPIIEIAQINGNNMMYAASLPKIAILFGLLKRVSEGTISWTPEIEQLATEMIRYSSNEAASELFYKTGPNFIESQLEDFNLYDLRNGGGLWVGKEYGKGIAWRRDPLLNISHAASAMKVAQLYYLLESGHLLPANQAKIMKEVLSNPGLNHKFVKGLHSVCPDAKLFRKSGSWSTFHSDSALISNGEKNYIAVALLNDPNGQGILENLIVDLDQIVTGKGSTHCRSFSPEIVTASAPSPEVKS